MFRNSLFVVATVALLCDAVQAFAPAASLAARKPTLALRSTSVKPTASFPAGKRKTLALMMSGGQEPPPPPQVEEPVVPTPQEIGAYSQEDEQKYIQESSGLGYRRNNQDSLLFAMGALILLIPFVAVGIAIGTGYIPLDYVR